MKRGIQVGDDDEEVVAATQEQQTSDSDDDEHLKNLSQVTTQVADDQHLQVHCPEGKDVTDFEKARACVGDQCAVAKGTLFHESCLYVTNGSGYCGECKALRIIYNAQP